MDTAVIINSMIITPHRVLLIFNRRATTNYSSCKSVELTTPTTRCEYLYCSYQLLLHQVKPATQHHHHDTPRGLRLCSSTATNNLQPRPSITHTILLTSNQERTSTSTSAADYREYHVLNRMQYSVQVLTSKAVHPTILFVLHTSRPICQPPRNAHVSPWG